MSTAFPSVKITQDRLLRIFKSIHSQEVTLAFEKVRALERLKKGLYNNLGGDFLIRQKQSHAQLHENFLWLKCHTHEKTGN